MVAAVDRELQQAVDDLDGDRSLAAAALRLRITAATTGRTVRVENIQGDVGTGQG